MQQQRKRRQTPINYTYEAKTKAHAKLIFVIHKGFNFFFRRRRIEQPKVLTNELECPEEFAALWQETLQAGAV